MVEIVGGPEEAHVSARKCSSGRHWRWNLWPPNTAACTPSCLFLSRRRRGEKCLEGWRRLLVQLLTFEALSHTQGSSVDTVPTLWTLSQRSCCPQLRWMAQTHTQISVAEKHKTFASLDLMWGREGRRRVYWKVHSCGASDLPTQNKHLQQGLTEPLSNVDSA